MQLVLSLFPGIGLLDMAFEREGFAVVQSRDWIFGGDVRKSHFPRGKFDGVIGGPPCQAFSRLAHMVRQNGYEPKFGNLIPEFERVVEEVSPQWFVMEQVPDAPRPCVPGYGNHEFTLNNRQCYNEDGAPAVQNRVRAITFGWRGGRKALLLDTVLFQSREFAYAACGGGRDVAVGGSGKVKGSRKRLNDYVGDNIKSKAALKRLCKLQGLPENFVDDLPFTVTAACKALGNGVPLPMGRTIARGIREITEQETL